MRYRVETWDSDADRFTEQPGVPCRHLPWWMLRHAIRRLRDYGYQAHKDQGGGDPSVLITRDGFPLVARDEAKEIESPVPLFRRQVQSGLVDLGSSWRRG